MSEKYHLSLVSVVDLDLEMKLVRVSVTEIEHRSFWRTVYVTRKEYFTYVGQGVWLDEKNLAVSDTELRFKLQELLVAEVANKKLDKYIATP